jgi:uncharacterized phiE125 gp8 family phage protein
VAGNPAAGLIVQSAPIVITPPAVEPIERSAAKQFLRIDDVDQDLEVDMMIAAARGDLEDATGQRLINQTVKVLADSFAELEHLQVGPVQAITGVTYEDVAGTTQTLDPATYEVFGAGLECGVRRKVGASWPTARAAKGAIAVTLTVGYGADGSAVPQNLIFAIYALLRGKVDDVPVSIDTLIVNDRIGI